MKLIDSEIQYQSYANPIDMVEEVAESQQLPFNRASQDELVVEVEGQKTSYLMHFSWREDLGSLHFATSMNLPLAKKSSMSMLPLMAAINEKLWLGHFEVCSQLQRPLFRYTALLPEGGRNLNEDYIGQLIGVAMAECERFFPVFDLFLHKKPNLIDALELALIDPIGNA